MYNTIHEMSMAENSPQELRVTQLRPSVELALVWKNLHMTWVSEEAKSVWYIVIHDLVPTNERLNKIRRSDSVLCGQCERQDTLVYRLAECGEGMSIWEWTRKRLAWILRTDPLNGFFAPNFRYGRRKGKGQFYGY